MFVMSGQVFTRGWLIYVVRTFAILSTLLPFMLKLNVDVAKLFYAQEIGGDAHIEGTIVRNRQIPEELGRIEYLLSDKTGTLTRNEMIFKHLRTLSGSFSQDNFEALTNLGILRMETGDITRGIEAFHRLVAEQPESSMAYYLLAKAYTTQGRADDEVLNLAERAVKIDPGFERARRLVEAIRARRRRP